MTDLTVSFGSPLYLLLLLVLVLARGADFLSTWIATPNLTLEANPIAKMLHWKWGAALNVVMCLFFATWPLPAIIIGTTSALVAARNFQVAWMMRSLGEDNYRNWIVQRLEETPVTLFLFCLFAQTVLVGAVGGVLIGFSRWQLVPLGVGMGLVAYALAVLIFSLISIWRRRRQYSHDL